MTGLGVSMFAHERRTGRPTEQAVKIDGRSSGAVELLAAERCGGIDSATG